jgi:uncharacterized protein
MSFEDCALGALVAFVVATITTPAGVSGAVFLLPVQVSLLHAPNPALTPTNLLFNVVSTPGALIRFAREGRLASPLTSALLIGTLPGVVIGAVARVELLQDPRVFYGVMAAVLGPLGLWLASGRTDRGRRPPPDPGRRLSALAVAAGVVGGVYGIGGGSLLGPVLVIMGFSVFEIGPAALSCTFATSLVGVATYQLLELVGGGGRAIAPEWILGLSMGAGGMCGSYLGARLQHRVSELGLRRLLGTVCLALALRYGLQAGGA